MNYVISYWVPPDMSQQRRDSLRRYFDVQRYSKAQFGAEQIIVTNLDYPGAVPFIEPPGFKREYALFAMYFGLGQLIDEGLTFPITVHDHDLFIKGPIKPSASIQSVGELPQGSFSEQFIVFPEKAKTAVINYIDYLKRFDFTKHRRFNAGSEVRHEGMYSSELALVSQANSPFAKFDLDVSIRDRDIVSYDIVRHHSLDAAYCESRPIAASDEAVHGHLNKGPASDILLQWLAS